MSFIKSAEQILIDVGINSPEQIDLELIAFSLNARVKYRPLDGCAARIIGCNGKAIISVDPYKCSEGRKRFSIGHEIGHWVNDRQKGVHLCSNSSISDTDNAANQSERLANSFSSDLLLPKFLLQPRLQGRDINFITMKELAGEFNSSLTATCIKSINLTDKPVMLVSFKKNGSTWFRRSRDITDEIWPVKELHHESLAFRLLYGQVDKEAGPAAVKAHVWINHRYPTDYKIIEHSKKISEDQVISLLSWKDKK